MSQWKKTSCSTAAIYKPKRKKVHMYFYFIWRTRVSNVELWNMKSDRKKEQAAQSKMKKLDLYDSDFLC